MYLEWRQRKPHSNIASVSQMSHHTTIVFTINFHSAEMIPIWILIYFLIRTSSKNVSICVQCKNASEFGYFDLTQNRTCDYYSDYFIHAIVAVEFEHCFWLFLNAKRAIRANNSSEILYCAHCTHEIYSLVLLGFMQCGLIRSTSVTINIALCIGGRS